MSEKKCLLHVHINSQGKKYLLCRDNVFGTTLFLYLCKQHKPFERARGKHAVLNKLFLAPVSRSNCAPLKPVSRVKLSLPES